jgi:hypothetical protein
MHSVKALGYRIKIPYGSSLGEWHPPKARFVFGPFPHGPSERWGIAIAPFHRCLRSNHQRAGGKITVVPISKMFFGLPWALKLRLRSATILRRPAGCTHR